MLRLLIIALAGLLSVGCADTTVVGTQHRTGRFKARVTYYHKGEAGGDHVAMTSKLRAKEGVTAAASPAIPFGTKIEIPKLAGIVGNGEFEVQDRGRDVTREKASHGKYPVIDIYVSRKKYNWLKSHLEPLLDVSL